MKMMIKIFTTSIVLLGVNLVVFAQEGVPPLVTDRPDQTESSVTVPKGSLQIETGYTFENINENYTSQTIGGTLLRYGLLRNFELRFGASYKNEKFEMDETIAIIGMLPPEKDFTGFSPVMIGTKINIGEENGIIPEMAILTEFTLGGTGDDVFYENNTGTKILFAFSHTLNDFLGFGYNLGLEHDGNEPGANLMYSFVLGVAPIEGLGAFFEVYGSSLKNHVPDHRVDAGLTYLLTDNFQFDLSGGIGLSDTSPNNFISAGVSYRIIKK